MRFNPVKCDSDITMATSESTPALSTRSSSSDQASRIVGKLDADGIAIFDVEGTSAATQSAGALPRSLNIALDTAARNTNHSGLSTPGSSSEEDYDDLRHDPLTVVAGGRGGGFDRGRDATPNHKEEVSEDIEKESHTAKNRRPVPLKLKSIPIILKKTDQKGQYRLIADDVEIREILKRVVERVSCFNNSIMLGPLICRRKRTQSTPRRARNSVT